MYRCEEDALSERRGTLDVTVVVSYEFWLAAALLDGGGAEEVAEGAAVTAAVEGVFEACLEAAPGVAGGGEREDATDDSCEDAGVAAADDLADSCVGFIAAACDGLKKSRMDFVMFARITCSDQESRRRSMERRFDLSICVWPRESISINTDNFATKL